jgi:predicted transcriptional regulator
MTKNEKLSRREREIVDLLFALGGEATAEEIRERLIEPPSYSAVRAMLSKLEAKGAIRHREQGPRYVYSPTIARSAARRSALRKLVATFFEGSPGQAMTALLNDEKWSEDELDQLSIEIERAKHARRKP